MSKHIVPNTPDGQPLEPQENAGGNGQDQQAAGQDATDGVQKASDAETLDPFDPENLRLSQDFNAMVAVKKLRLTVPVRKPAKEWWVRTHPHPAYRLQTAVIELKEDRETYLVDPSLWPELATESTLSPRALFTSANRDGVIFLWPVRLPGPDGRIDEWSRSALEAAELATHDWVRVQANMSLGAYDIEEVDKTKVHVPIPEPDWPQEAFRDLLRVAFKDRRIDTLDHPVLRRLRGEA